MDCDSKESGHGTALSWVFVLRPKQLPGQFEVQPLRPEPIELPDIVLRGACSALKEAGELMEKLNGATPFGDNATKVFALVLEHMIFTRFGGLVPVEVITMEELFARAEQGEFKLRILRPREVKGMNRRLGRVQAEVFNQEAQ